jgi:putative membrane protein
MCGIEQEGTYMRALFIRATLAFVGLALAGAAYAQPRPGETLPQDRKGAPVTQNQQGPALSPQDREFIRSAMEAGNTEVILGKLAQEKSTSEEIKKFGERMVQDHSKAGEQLKAIAKKLGFKPPSEPEAKKKEDVITMLEDLSDDEFNMSYSMVMVKAHKQAVSLFQKQAKEGDAPELRQFAEKALPVLQEHLKMARNLPPVKKAAQKWKK